MAYRHRPEKYHDMDNSGLLFNVIRKKFNLPSDRQMCSLLKVTDASVSKIRHGSAVVGPKIILAIHEATDIPVKEIRRLISMGAVPPGE